MGDESVVAITETGGATKESSQDRKEKKRTATTLAAFRKAIAGKNVESEYLDRWYAQMKRKIRLEFEDTLEGQANTIAALSDRVDELMKELEARDCQTRWRSFKTWVYRLVNPRPHPLDTLFVRYYEGMDIADSEKFGRHLDLFSVPHVWVPASIELTYVNKDGERKVIAPVRGIVGSEMKGRRE